MSTLSTTNLKNPSSGSNNIVLGTDGSTTITTLSATTITGTSVRGGITSGTAVASTSGVAIDFTGIPSWVKRITVMFNGVSTNGTSNIQLQTGDAGGIEITGYNSSCSNQGGNLATDFTTGFGVSVGISAATIHSGKYVIDLLSGNTWAGMGIAGLIGGGVRFGAGSKTLSGTLDRVRITTVNGTDTFDAGSINILYEG